MPNFWWFWPKLSYNLSKNSFRGLFGSRILLNSIWLTMKFHNHHEADIHTNTITVLPRMSGHKYVCILKWHISSKQMFFEAWWVIEREGGDVVHLALFAVCCALCSFFFCHGGIWWIFFISGRNHSQNPYLKYRREIGLRTGAYLRFWHPRDPLS